MAKDKGANQESNKEKYLRDEEFSKGLDTVKTAHSASAKDIEAIQKLKGGKISNDTFALLYDQLIGPAEAAKMLTKDHYKAFVRAIAIGNIGDETVIDPETGDRVSMIQLVFEGIKNGDPKALDIAKSRSKKSSGPLKKKSVDFRDFLKGKEDRVAEKKEREESKPEQLTSEFAGKAVQLTESSKTHGEISEVVSSQNWNIPEMPAEIRTERTELRQKLDALYKQNEKLESEVKDLEDKHSEQLKKAPDIKALAVLKKKIYDKEEEVIAADKQIDQLTRECEALGQPFLEEELSPKVEFLLQTEKELGYDLRFVPSLRGKGENSEVLYTDLSIEFREEWVVIHFTENGKPKKMPWEKFKNHSYAIGLHPDYKSLEELNEEMETQGHLPLEEGQEFYGKPESKPIKVISINDGTVTLENAVKTRNSNRLRNGTDPRYAVDKIQRTMPYGAFLSFIQRENYKQDGDPQTITDQRFKGEDRRARRNCRGICSEELFEAMGGVPGRSMDLSSGQTMQYAHDRTATMGPNGQLLDSVTKRPISLHTGHDTGSSGIGLGTLAGGMAAANDDMERDYAINLKTAKGRRNFQQQNISNDVAAAAPTPAPTATTAAPTEAAAPAVAEEPTDLTLPGGEESKSTGPKEKTQKTYKEEGLPYSEVFKHGGMKEESRSWMKGFWANTYFLRGHDIFEMGKSMYEYYVRRWERKQKERYSSVAEDVPYFSPEMKRVKQAAENEEVDQFKSSMEQTGNAAIQETLRSTGNLDEMKAAIVVLTDKGQMRWDDIEFWRNLNRHVHSSVSIPIPPSGDPAHRISDKDDRTGVDFLKDALDSLWGEGSYDTWYSGNKSKYQSNAKGFYEEGSELEGVEGGHQRRLEGLLLAHKRGDYVDPHRFEGLILHMIENGKSSMQSKVYYLVQGVAAQNPNGHTILSFDRMAHVNSALLVKFPLLDYMCASVQRSDGKSHRWTIDDYRQWAKWFDDGNPMNAKPTPAVDRFLWKYVLPSDETQTRINKAIRNGKDLDHDDMFGYLPPATEQVIQDACKSVGGGSTRVLTTEGYANAFPGFSQFFRTLAEADNRNKLKETIKSFVRFESIMTNRWMKNNEGYARLDDSTRHSPTVVSDEPPDFFIKELGGAVKAVVEAYKDEGLIDLYELATRDVEGVRTDPKKEKEQKAVQEALEKFGSKFNEVVKRDEGALMVATIKGRNLYGMPKFVSDSEKDARKAEMLSGFESDVNLSY